jgi:hypothetical protein
VDTVIPDQIKPPTVEVTQPNPTNFFDAGAGVDPGAVLDSLAGPQLPEPPKVVLQMVGQNGESFTLERRIGYVDGELGPLIVPLHLDDFETDLASVPALFTWLVPKTGLHLPAAIIHDGLVNPGGKPTYYAPAVKVVWRWQADRAFRDMMRDAGTGVIRRWLMWSAVTIGTIRDGRDTGWTTIRKWRYRGAVALTVAVVVALGFLATMDLLDRTWFWALPWMGDRGWFTELAGGLSGAVVIPLVLALLWGQFRVAGAVVGVTLAVLLHVTVALLALTAAYRALEWLTAKAPTVVVVLAAAVVAAALAVFVTLL